jgi:hypothetical protein
MEAAVDAKVVVKKGTELAGNLASHAEDVLDDAARALFGEAWLVATALGPPMDNLLVMAGKGEKAAEKLVSKGGRITAKATEKAVEAVKEAKGIVLKAREETHLYHRVVQRLCKELAKVKGLLILIN